MPSNASVSLDVRNFPSNGSDGYTNTTASNNAIYSYCYTGGTHGGDVTFQGRGQVTLTVHLNSDPRYQINTVGFVNDTNNQLSLQPENSPTTAVIKDINTVVQDAAYKVTVSDTTANCTIPCDPQINNK